MSRRSSVPHRTGAGSRVGLDPIATAPARPAGEAPTASERPDWATLAALQRLAGNAAVATLFAPTTVQRAGPEGDEGPAVNPKADDLRSDLWTYWLEMLEANVKHPSRTRLRWAEACGKLIEKASAEGERTDAEVAALRKAFEQLEDAFVDENLAALDLWAEVEQEYEAERAYLLEDVLPEEMAAADILLEAHTLTAEKVAALGPHLVQQDIAGLHQMLESGAHLAEGRRRAARMQDEFERAKAASEERDEDVQVDDSLGLTDAAQIVLGDDLAEFGLDLLLTVVTLGSGKVVKVLVRYRRAKKLGVLTRLARLRKLRRAKRAKRLAGGALDLAKAAAKTIGGALSDHGGWIKANWKKSAKAYLTDEAANVASGGSAADAKTYLERLGKDAAQAIAERYLGYGKDAEKKQFQTAVLAYAAGSSGVGEAFLKGYFALNLKRRGLGNMLYYAARAGSLESHLDRKLAIKAAGSIGGDMAQDFVLNGARFTPAGERIIETARKTVQNAVVKALETALV